MTIQLDGLGFRIRALGRMTCKRHGRVQTRDHYKAKPADPAPSSNCSASQRSPPRMPLLAIDLILDDPGPANRSALRAIFSGMLNLTRTGGFEGADCLCLETG